MDMKTGDLFTWMGIPLKLKAHSFAVAGCVLLAVIAGGCKPPDAYVSSQPPGTPAPIPYFKTQFQDECQYIVETIATDVAEQIYYAKHYRLPDAGKFSVHAVEQPGSLFRHPIYEFSIDYGDGQPPLREKVDINGPIWDAAVYRGLTSALAERVGLAKPAQAAVESNTALLRALTDGSARTVELKNEEVSKALTANFTDPTLHEEAALIVGAFTVRENAGSFCDVRAPLCRITAHLCMSQFLEDGAAAGIDAQIANIILLTMSEDQTAALAAIGGVKSDDPAVKAWLRAQRTIATMDYRELAGQSGATPIERQAWYLEECISGDPDVAWNSLTDTEKKDPDFIRIANVFTQTVDVGHQLLASALSAEMSELGAIYHLSQGKLLKQQEVVDALNVPPGGCFTTGSNGAPVVTVIGWGQWAGFFQRHLCDAVKQNFAFMQWGWGVPDDAAKFRTELDNAFGGLRLYPFVRRFDSTEVAYYRSAVDDGYKVTVESPQLVPIDCWNHLTYAPDFTQLYRPVANPHINEWYKHNPPPGTVFIIFPRLHQNSLSHRLNSDQVLAGLHAQAPYDYPLSSFILDRTTQGHPTAEQAEAQLRDVLPFNSDAMAYVAETERGNPARFEQLLSAAAKITPGYYGGLAEYFDLRHDTEKAATYYEKVSQFSDAVSGANVSLWLVSYYLKKGDSAHAKAIADNGAEVYSYTGLQAEAYFHEATGDDAGALDWYQKIAERYDKGDGNLALAGFYIRYRNRTGDRRFDSQLQSMIGNVFPSGVESASIANFSGPPTDGARFTSSSDDLEAAGMHSGDIVVAVSGVRVHNCDQYYSAREFPSGEGMDMIVWNGAYREIKVSSLIRRFGVEMKDYTPGK
jgi:hypothetical protein